MPYQRKKTAARRPRRRPAQSYKSKNFNRAVTRVIRKREPAGEVRHSQTSTLVGNPSLLDSFAVYDISSLSNGTAINQKMTSKQYVVGIKFNLVITNADTVAKQFRLMVVQNKNPSDILDTANWTDIYETTGFAKKTIDASLGDAVSPINKDVLRILADKKFVVPQKHEGAVTKSFWVPIKRNWTYKTVVSESACSNGRTFIVCQATDYTAPSTFGVTFQWFARMYFKPSGNV